MTEPEPFEVLTEVDKAADEATGIDLRRLLNKLGLKNSV
jgi:hypothetical protein